MVRHIDGGSQGRGEHLSPPHPSSLLISRGKSRPKSMSRGGGPPRDPLSLSCLLPPPSSFPTLSKFQALEETGSWPASDDPMRRRGVFECGRDACSQEWTPRLWKHSWGGGGAGQQRSETLHDNNNDDDDDDDDDDPRESKQQNDRKCFMGTRKS